jgi:glycosyltransferase involved in cell wall biosynthesis
MLRRKKIILLHCFPVPYRNHLFEAISNECQNNNLDFEVHFFSNFDSSRPKWRFQSSELNFKNFYWKPIFKYGPSLHLNIDLLFYLLKNKPDLIVLGGVWSSINTILLTIFSRNIPLVAWDETNRFDFGNVKKNFYWFKRYLINKLTYFAIPGLESKFFYREILDTKSFSAKKFFYLPNLVDERLFNISNISRFEIYNFRKKYKIPFDKKIAYWPARFIPHKGIINFIKFLNEDVLRDWIIVILGNGPLKDDSIKFISEKNLESYFLIYDVMPYEEALKLYFLSNLLIMPSISDSNPLSVIEAIHSSLPILVSNRIGNYNEVLNDKKNGVGVDPLIDSSMNQGIEFIFKKNKSELYEMGKISKALALKNYSTVSTIKNFVRDLIDILG